MQYITAEYWDAGAGGRMNQDSLTVQQALTRRGRVLLAAVCDGIGGLPEGETASGYVTKRLTEWFYREALPLMEKGRGRESIRRSGLRMLYDTAEQMKRYAMDRKICFGTTMTAVLLHKREYLWFHAGDSRLYRYGGRQAGVLRGKPTAAGGVRLTQDHSAGEHALTRCIGSFSWQRPDTGHGRVHREQCLLLCTDGFRRLAEAKLQQILVPEEIREEEQARRRLAEIARYSKERGEPDNLSAVYIGLRRKA